MTRLQGLGASPGTVSGKAFVLRAPDLSYPRHTNLDPDAQTQRFQAALAQARTQLERVRDQLRAAAGETHAAIFTAHLELLDDPEIQEQVQDTLTSGVSAEEAVDTVMGGFISMFEALPDPYMRERAADVRDLRDRLLANLLGVTHVHLGSIAEPVILVARDLTPSDTAQLNPDVIHAFVTEIGGTTSHSAIMARSLEIPAVVGVAGLLDRIADGQALIVNGETGDVNLTPTPEAQAEAQRERAQQHEQRARLTAFRDQPSVTADGHHIDVAVNIGTPEDLEGVLRVGADGIGLFRTEFLYMGRPTLPTEQEQYEAYRTVLAGLNGKPVVIRTLDIGGDKTLPTLQPAHEDNPFLGLRALRLCLANPDLFRTQLRALLRASVHGKLQIMFPMVSTLQELRDAKALLEDARAQLIAEGQPVGTPEVGIMIEVPAAALAADLLAPEVDFFSIGTNDLIAYTFAADRMNTAVAYLYQPYHPSILRLIKLVVDAANQHGKWVGVCGEMAGEAQALPILVGLGVRELSMNASSVLRTRQALRDLNLDALQRSTPALLQTPAH